MVIQHNYISEPEQGTTRIINKFLLIPIRIGYITKWLETAAIEQNYEFKDMQRKKLFWKNTKFL